MNTFPAGTGEKMQYLVHEYNDNTIRFVLRYPGLIDETLLCSAMRAVVMSVDILHSSFDPDAPHARWICHDELEDQDFFQLIPHAQDAAQEALRQCLQPVAPQGRAQLRCCLVKGHADSAIALCMSHLCVDGSDARYLLQKIAEACNLIRHEGSVQNLHIKNGSRAPEQLYQNLPQKELRPLMRSPATGIKSPFPFATDEPGEPRIAHLMIPASIMDTARIRAKAAGATANDVLVAACYSAYAATPGVDPRAQMSVMGMMDLRRHCAAGDSEGLSNLSGSLATVLPEGIPETFDALLQEIAAQTRQKKSDPHAGLVGIPLIHAAVHKIPLKLLIRLAGGVYGSVGIGLTNMGGIRCADLALDGLTPTAGWFGGPLKKKPHMQVSAASFDGACALTIAGCYTQQDETALQAFLERMAQAVTAYAQ